MRIKNKLGFLRREICARRRRGGRLNVANDGRLWLPTIARNGGIGLELGVASGYFSRVILRNSPLSQLYSIDCWADHHDGAEYLQCCKALRPFGDRSIVLRMYFDEAVSLFDDGFFDFIYVDAYAGTGQEEGRILEKWWPKIRSGGVFGGHDYDERWLPTVRSVDLFCSSIGRTVKVVPGVENGHNHDKYASWFIIK